MAQLAFITNHVYSDADLWTMNRVEGTKTAEALISIADGLDLGKSGLTTDGLHTSLS